jgi:hypothetical protein
LAEEIFEIAPGFLIRKLGRGGTLNCFRRFLFSKLGLGDT